MTRRFSFLLASAALFVPAILTCDGRGLARQALLAFLTGAFLLIAARVAAVDRTQILGAIAIATLGEVVLSVLWGLYSYRFTAVIPLYVPLGHGLFYTLAAGSARQPWMRQHATSISRGVLVGGSAVAAGSLLLFRDQWGLLWWIAAALLIARSRSQLLLSLCCTYTMLLEWAGTWIGNWRWEPTVPLVGLHSANPPSGVGILYVLLDLLTVALCAWFLRRRVRLTYRLPALPAVAAFGTTPSPLPSLSFDDEAEGRHHWRSTHGNDIQGGDLIDRVDRAPEERAPLHLAVSAYPLRSI